MPRQISAVTNAGGYPGSPYFKITGNNTATVTELMQLPRIGQKTAERIVAFRKEHGGFQRPEELMNVKGIGEKNFAKIEAWLTVGEAPKAASK